MSFFFMFVVIASCLVVLIQQGAFADGRTASKATQGEWPENWPPRARRRVGLSLGMVCAVFFFFLLSAHLHHFERMLMFGLTALALGMLFLWIWQREFLFLMAQRDDAFPGQFDKPIWAVFLITMAPLSLWLFRAYRLSQWPEPEPKPKPVRGQSTAADFF